MEKINTTAIRTNAIGIFGDLKKLTSAYVSYATKMTELRSARQYSIEYIERKEKEYSEELKTTALKVRETMTSYLEKMQEVITENNKVFDFSDPELANCITLLQSSGNKVPYEVMNNIATRFMGNRQALLTLKELVPESYKNMFDEGLFDVKSRVDNLADSVWQITEKPKENIFGVITLKNDLKKFAKFSGIEFTDEEIDLGEDYQSLVTMQIRSVAGLGTADI